MPDDIGHEITGDKNMPTIKEIAALAGVSRGTVDRVLNKRGGVHPDTKARILEIAKALDYRPNKAGIVLSAQRKNLKLGVVMFGTNNPFFDDVKAGLKQIESELSCYNCTIYINATTSFREQDQIDAIDELVEKGIHALAIAPQNQEGVVKKVDELAAKGIPTITFNSDLPSSKRIAYVGSNYRKSGQTVAGLMKLFNQGSKLNIGIIGGAKSVLCHTERIEGFKDIASSQAAKKILNIVDVVWNNDDDVTCYQVVDEMLKAHPEINALYFTAGAISGGCRAVIEQGRNKGMLIITHDSVPSTVELVKKGIIQATVCQQPYIQGVKPLQMLFDYLTTGEVVEEINYTDIEIFIKENI